MDIMKCFGNMLNQKAVRYTETLDPEDTMSVSIMTVAYDGYMNGAYDMLSGQWHKPEVLPETDDECVVRYKDEFGEHFAIGCYSGGQWFSEDDNWKDRGSILGWMYVPAMPESDSDKDE